MTAPRAVLPESAFQPRIDEKPTPDEFPPIDTVLWKCAKAICRVATTLCFDLKVYDADLLPRTGGVLMVSNHQSYLDPVLVAVKISRPMTYLAKSELFKNPVFSYVIRKLNAFPVKQGAGDIGAIKEAIKRLRDGHVLNVFPEGSRTETGARLPIQPGVALIVHRAHVPVIPVLIEGSFQSWPKRRKLPRCNRIRVIYGQPARIDDRTTTEIMQWIDEQFTQLDAQLKSKAKSRMEL